MSTIITAFLSNSNNYRFTPDYIYYGKKLLSHPIPIICFIEEEIYNEYFNDYSLDNYPNTKFLYFSKNEMYFNNYLKYITEFNLNTDNPNKDTLQYILVQCFKTEWIKMGISNNYFNTENFLWLDFGLYHIVNNDEQFINSLNKLVNKNYSKIRIPCCKDPNIQIPNENYIYQRIYWYFCGGIFGGNKDHLVKFADIMKQKCIDIIINKKTLMWEVNIWYMIYQDHKDLFDFYIADHNISMLNNY